MKFKFSKQPLKDVVQKLIASMSGRQLADMVSIAEEGSQLVVKISKLGTSTLTFAKTETASDVILELKEEKIAFTHKAFKNDVTDKLCRVVEKAGGQVVS